MKILCIGNPLFDRTLHVKMVPEGLRKSKTTVGDKEKVENLWLEMNGSNDFKWSLGGSCTNVVRALSCLIDSPCSLLGMVGKDKCQEIGEKLEEFRVENRLIVGKEDNGFVNCFVTDDSERTMQAYPGAAFELSKEYIQPQHFEKVSHVHLEGYLAYPKDVLSTIIAQCKQTTVSLDLSSTDVIRDCSDQLRECANKVDILFGNLEEMRAFADRTEIEEMFEYFEPRQIVVITNGSKGGWFKDKDANQFIPFDAVKTDNCLDTTGAGDFFIAGFLAGFLDKKDIKVGIKIATLAASYVIQQDGTELPKEKWEELKENIVSLSEMKI